MVSTHLRIYASTFLVLLLARPGWGVVYYVSPTGSNTSPYDTWAKAATLPSTVLALIASAVDTTDTIYIGAGLYTANEVLRLSSDKHSNLTIVGAGCDSTVVQSNSGAVLVGYNARPDDVIVRDLTLVANAANAAAVEMYYASLRWLLEDVAIVSGASHDNHLIYLAGTSSLTLKNCVVRSRATSSYYWLTARESSVTVCQNCIITQTAESSLSDPAYLIGDGTSTFYGCVFDVPRSTAIIGANTRAIVVENCIIAGSCGNRLAYTVSVPSANLTARNCHVLSNPWSLENSWFEQAPGVSSGNIQTNVWPAYKAPARNGYILPCIDDTANLDHAVALSGVMVPLGVSGTFFLYQHAWDPGNDSVARQLVSDGAIELAMHGYSHTSVRYTHGLRVTYTGIEANPAVSLTAGRVIQLRTTEGGDNADIDTTNASYDTLGEIVLAAPANWGIAKSSTDGQEPTTNIMDSCRATSLAVKTSTAVGSGVDLDFDTSGYSAGFYKDEITDPKTWMTDVLINGSGPVTDPQTGATYECRTWACPFHESSTTARQAMIDAGYTLARGHAAGTTYATERTYLVSPDLYYVGCVGASEICSGQTEADVRSQARAFGYCVAQTGSAVSFLEHSIEDTTPQEWGWIFDEWSRIPNLVVCSHQLFADHVRNSGLWTDDGDGTFSRTYGRYTDYYPLKNSPLIDAGTALGDSYDNDFLGYDQDRYGLGWDIGAYAYRPKFLIKP